VGFDADLIAADIGEIETAKRRAPGLCRQRRGALELRRIELDDRAQIGAVGAVGTAAGIERQLQSRRSRAGATGVSQALT
jgi:hypothetical protein